MSNPLSSTNDVSPGAGFIDEELADFQQRIHKQRYCSLVACVPVMVRVAIVKNKMKSMDVCMQFPPDYPAQMALVELKSKTLPTRFLDTLLKAVDSKQSDFVSNGQRRQLLPILDFVLDFLDANPLCVVAEEISQIRQSLNLGGPPPPPANGGQLESTNSANSQDYVKIRQKTSTLIFHLTQGAYFLDACVTIPDDVYPTERVGVDITRCNFPELFQWFFAGQAREIARQCVERPVMVKKGKDGKLRHNTDQNFQPKPSLTPVVQFLITSVKRYPLDHCGLCDKLCFPPDPADVITDPNGDAFIERVYCSHIFHHSCIDMYMRTPPFGKGGKKCPSCASVIYHDKWRSSDQARENRWAHQQAKQRELEEVEDFLS